MADLGHNSGMSPEDAAAAMERALAPHQDRRAEFERKAAAAKVADLDDARGAIDFIRMSRALADKGRDLLTEIAQPYRDCEAAARGVALRFIENLEASTAAMNDRLRAYNADRHAKAEQAAAAQRDAEEELRRQAAERNGGGPEATPPAPPGPPPTSRRRKAPSIRTDLGGRFTEHERWRAKVVDVTKVPETVLKSPRVIEAIAKVATDLLKNGIDVPGVEKEDYTTHSIS